MAQCEYCGARTGMHGFSFEKEPKPQKESLRELSLLDWGFDDSPMVCVVHLRFVPCRRDEPGSHCHKAINAEAVEIVRQYQLSEITESEAYARLDRKEYR